MEDFDGSAQDIESRRKSDRFEGRTFDFSMKSVDKKLEDAGIKKIKKARVSKISPEKKLERQWQKLSKRMTNLSQKEIKKIKKSERGRSDLQKSFADLRTWN